MGFLAGGDLFFLVVGGGANALSTWFLLEKQHGFYSIPSVVEAFFWGVMTRYVKGTYTEQVTLG